MHYHINKQHLFTISCLAIMTEGIAFSIRAGVALDLQHFFSNSLLQQEAASIVAIILGLPFLGFALSMAVGGIITDRLGIKTLLLGSAINFILATVLFQLKFPNIHQQFLIYKAAALCFGLGWGLVETTTNPLVIAMYKDGERTEKLNKLHAWWPAGIVVGALLVMLLEKFNISWQSKLLCTLVPTLIYGAWAAVTNFPHTERIQKGYSDKEMLKTIIEKPSFFIWFGLMFFTASTELAPSSWIDLALSYTTGMRGIWLLSLVAGIMFIVRQFATTYIRNIPQVKLLLMCSMLSAIGLFLLSFATNPVTAIGATFIWGIGVALIWPTMISVVSIRFVKAGTFALGLLATAGSLTNYLILPFIGKLYDQSYHRFLAIFPEETAHFHAAQHSFFYFSLIPCILIAGFSLIYHFDKKSKYFNLNHLSI